MDGERSNVITMDFAQHPHRRYNPLKNEWVLVSPHRNNRPWQGHVETIPVVRKPAHDPACHLCARNTRAGQHVNPNYEGPFVFDNDFPALLADTPSALQEDPEGLMRAQMVQGAARVICFSERHDLTLPELPVTAIRKVIDTWCDQLADLGQRWKWVAIFENKGSVMGCSNPHPHGQIWAGDFLPNEVVCEDTAQSAYLSAHGRNLLQTYAAREAKDGARTVIENDDWIAVVPWWAVWPFETLLLPKRHVQRLTDLSAAGRDSLADALKRLTTAYDNLFETEFPYTFGWHGAPLAPGSYDHWQLHAHFYPPLLRSASVRKFMVGYEMLAEAQRDLTAETAAQRLRSLPQRHYLGRRDA